MPTLKTIEINPKSPPKNSVIWLHGLGADGYDFVPIVAELQLPDELAIRFVFPHAPMRPVTINNSYTMRAWYDIYTLDTQMKEDEAGLRKSYNLIQELILAEENSGIKSENIILAGFSQGGAMALFSGLRYPKPLGGILALSAYLPLALTLPKEGSKANQKTPILMLHGTFDEVVPVVLAQMSKDFLMKEYEVELDLFPMGHQVVAEELLRIEGWLRERCH
jgi:phospholipase/carboxylesterase